MYKHILLATELTNESKAIEDRAAIIQKLTGAKFSIIHVNEFVPPMYPVGEVAAPYSYGETQEMLAKTAKEMLSKLQNRLAIPHAELTVKEGSISGEIVNFADERGVDLIITGSHGRHGIKMLLGSTANAILHHAKCDVLAVRIKD